jgi:hypothetical protein
MINILKVGSKGIEAQFVLNNNEDEQASCNTDGKPRYINSSISFVAYNVSPGDFEVTFEHTK